MTIHEYINYATWQMQQTLHYIIISYEAATKWKKLDQTHMVIQFNLKITNRQKQTRCQHLKTDIAITPMKFFKILLLFRRKTNQKACNSQKISIRFQKVIGMSTQFEIYQREKNIIMFLPAQTWTEKSLQTRVSIM